MDYQPVPVEVARKIAFDYSKQCVVIACYDDAFQQTHVTTYGQEPQHKEMASRAGDQVGQVLSGTIAKTSFEDFRNRTQAEWAQEKDALLREIARLKDAIWPGLSEWPWKPTQDRPQQNFHEAVLESLHAESSVIEAIEALRENEGSSVTILCENPDADESQPLNVVEVIDDWTGWETKRFGGDTLLLAIQAAMAAKTLQAEESR